MGNLNDRLRQRKHSDDVDVSDDTRAALLRLINDTIHCAGTCAPCRKRIELLAGDPEAVAAYELAQAGHDANAPALSTRSCETCGKSFQPARSSARYCSRACRQRAYRHRVTLSDEHSVTQDALSVTHSVTHKPTNNTD